jgi:hypothetical protein
MGLTGALWHHQTLSKCVLNAWMLFLGAGCAMSIDIMFGHYSHVRFAVHTPCVHSAHSNTCSFYINACVK